VNVYNALRALDARQDLAERTPEQISANAISGQCDLCREALTMMILFLGRVAGNLALTLNAKGGIYIAGGIISQLGAYFYDSDFRTEFISKGRFETYLDTIPTYVIENPLVAFTGLHADLFAQQSY
jgi:glucokinase